MEEKKDQEAPTTDPKKEQPEQEPVKNDLTEKDIPDSTNESTGATGSGQRQDSN